LVMVLHFGHGATFWSWCYILVMALHFEHFCLTLCRPHCKSVGDESPKLLVQAVLRASTRQMKVALQRSPLLFGNHRIYIYLFLDDMHLSDSKMPYPYCSDTMRTIVLPRPVKLSRPQSNPRCCSSQAFCSTHEACFLAQRLQVAPQPS
jgi:hypothetical protein